MKNCMFFSLLALVYKIGYGEADGILCISSVQHGAHTVQCGVLLLEQRRESGKAPARAKKIISATSRRLCTWDFFLNFFFFLLLIVDSVGVQLLTVAYKRCCRILLSLLQILGLLCCNFRVSVFVCPIIDLILVLNFQQVAIVGTDLAVFLYMES